MKAKISKIKSECTLSVGMIVKNEEKHLNDCLTALKPLLDAVSSELVIVDTGSTDSTVEIAKRFTDKIYHFDWINDFSAARNFGLDKCVGEWFMFLDADDIFDSDMSEMVDFFTDRKKLDKYNSASYTTKNYIKPDGSDFSMSINGRIVKRFPGLRFIHPIHEGFSYMPEPQYLFDTFDHHWGYAYETEEAKKAKQHRNLSLLLKELEKHPDDLRTHMHILNEIDFEERDRRFPEILEKARKQKGVIQAETAFVRAILYYHEKSNHEKTLKLIDEFLSAYKSSGPNILWLDVYVSKGAALQKIGKFDEAAKAFEEYFRLYDLYKSGGLNIIGLGTMPITYCFEEEHRKVKLGYAAMKLTDNGQKTISFDASGSIIKKEAKNRDGEPEIPAELPGEATSEETDGVILSVGMIVKNEEKYLNDCLTALKPLLDAVSSELVIVDTGSTDSTVEIAQRFTDKVYHFDWVNDFSAARNFGLDKCVGEWFMFIDADEIFDGDLDAIIRFFKNRSFRSKYGSATYRRRNYTTVDGSQWTEYVKFHIVKRYNSLRFVNPIHESFEHIPEPVFNLPVFTHHWGYAFETDEQKEAKKQRNLTLLYKELEKKPDDLRAYLHIYKELNEEEIRRFLPEFLDKARKKPNDPQAMVAFVNTILFYYMRDEYDRALRYIDEYFRIFKNSRKNVLSLDVLVCNGACLQKQGKIEKAVKVYRQYLALYKQYKDGRVNLDGLGTIALVFTEEDGYKKIKDRCDALAESLRQAGGNSVIKADGTADNNRPALSKADGITLSVGMIVKNEEKYLNDCLTALKPLLDAVSSELVIVDTGSDDSTVEIARRFTEKIYHFEWIGDFSAARNFGLDKCVGEWFMFLDADDIFDSDMSEMIGFFSDAKLREGYNGASYTTKNHIGIGKVTGSFDHTACRIGKKTEGLRFVNPIHECLTISAPRYDFKTFANHYGYLYADQQHREEKRTRNLLPLLNELKDNPDGVRLLYQILPEISAQEYEEYSKRALEAARRYTTNFSAPMFLVVIRNYISKRKYDEALSLIEEYVGRFKSRDVLLIDLYGLKGEILFEMSRYKEALDAFEEYFKYFGYNADGELDREPLTVMAAEYSGEKKLFVSKSLYAIAALNCGDYVRAAECIRDNFLDLDSLSTVNLINDFKNYVKDYVRATLCYCSDEVFAQSIGGLFWAFNAYSRAAIDSDELSPEDRVRFFERFANFAALYVTNVYNPALLNDDDVSALPELHRFGYYAAVIKSGGAVCVEDDGFDCAAYADVIRGLVKA